MQRQQTQRKESRFFFLKMKTSSKNDWNDWNNACITVLCSWGNAVTVDENKHSNDIPDDVLITD